MAISETLAALAAAFTAIDLFSFLKELLSRAGTATPPGAAPTLGTAVEVVLPLAAATVVLFTAVTLIHLHLAGSGAVGAANRRLSELLTFVVCGAAGTMQFFLSVQRGSVVDDAVGVLLARALGRAALEALPAAAAAVFFLGISLVIAHIRAGGEGGGGAALPDNRRVPVAVDVLKKMALGGAAALLSQIAMAALYVVN